MTQTQLVMTRAWCMPSADTFTMKPVAALLDRWLDGCRSIVDPFARNSVRGNVTNDLNPKVAAEHNLTANDFLEWLAGNDMQADAGLLDPPYSPRQIKDCYESIGMPVGQCETQHARLIAEAKDRMANIVRPGGIVICCGWNSQGMGKSRGFELLEVLLVGHGGSHNDTIVTVERKRESLFDETAVLA